MGRVAIGLAGSLALAGCPAASTQVPARLYVAASGAEFAQRLLDRTELPRWQVSLGSSSVLARQIAAGAPADVLLCANRTWVDWLSERGHLRGEPIELGWNHAVFAAGDERADSPPPGSLAELVRRLEPDQRLAIGDPGVPVGDLARTALAEAGVLADLEPHLVGFPDAGAVLRAVERGAVFGGFPFHTDASRADLEVAFRLSGRAALLACELRDSEHPARARELLSHLGTQASKTLLAELGFAPAGARAGQSQR